MIVKTTVVEAEVEAVAVNVEDIMETVVIVKTDPMGVRLNV